MGTATQTLIVIISTLIAKTGDEEGKLTAALAEVQAAETTEEAEIQALKTQVAALTPFDPTALEARVAALEAVGGGSGTVTDLAPLTARVAALEDRNAADDAAASNVPGVVAADGPIGGAATPLVLSPGPLPDAVMGQPYSAQIGVSGGVAPYQFSMLTGAMPDGLMLGAGGSITGQPTTAGPYIVDIQVHDANGATISANYGLTIDGPVVADGASIS